MASLLDLDTLRELFKNAVIRLKEESAEEPVHPGTMRLLSQSMLGDVFWKSRDTMLLAAIEEISGHKQGLRTAIVLEKPHYYSLNLLMEMRHSLSEKQKEKESLEWDKVFQLNSGSIEESDQDKVEKHVLLDILLETSLWNKPHVKNPFLYLEGSQHFSPEDKEMLSKTFGTLYRKYTSIK